MAAQWLRQIALTVGDSAGNALDLSQLHISFAVRGATTQTLKHATIRVYNLAPATMNRIQQEFTQISLQAGYEQPGVGQIFSGTISKITFGRQSATDTFVDLECFESDQAYNWAVTNTTLAAGWSPDDMHAALTKSVGLYGVTAGTVPTFPEAKMPRGRVMYGMTRDHLRTLGQSTGCDWNLQDGQINLIPQGGSLPQTIVLGPTTGLIGTPRLTIEGITAQCLLNPTIKSGMRVVIDNSYITDTIVKTPMTPEDIKTPSLDPRGVYKVLYTVHSGDTRGQQWQTEMVCSAIDGTQPLSGPAINAVPEVTS